LRIPHECGALQLFVSDVQTLKQTLHRFEVLFLAFVPV
jgi:hypothetical protein